MLKRVLNVGGSSNISRMDWYPELDRLDVWFHSRKPGHVDKYRYTNVGASEWAELVSADSVGSTFHRVIRSDAVKHPYERITWSLPPRDSKGRFRKAGVE